MPAQDPLGAMMNPMLPQARNPAVPQQTMVSPNAAPQRNMPPPPPPQPQMPLPSGAGLPAQAGLPAIPGTNPPGTPPMSAIMPQQMPDVVQMLMSRIMQQGGIPGRDMPQTQVSPTPGLQSAPLRGTTESVGGR